MRFRKCHSAAEEGSQNCGSGSGYAATESDLIHPSTTRQARFRIYSCVFCEFVQENMNETDLREEERDYTGALPDAVESKYLYHLASVHGLRR